MDPRIRIRKTDKKTFIKTGVTCCNEPGQLLALAVLPSGVSVPLGNEAGDRGQQVEDYHGEWIPVAKSKHQYGFKQEYTFFFLPHLIICLCLGSTKNCLG